MPKTLDTEKRESLTEQLSDLAKSDQVQELFFGTQKTSDETEELSKAMESLNLKDEADSGEKKVIDLESQSEEFCDNILDLLQMV